MSPKRGDRAAPPPRAGEYDIRFVDNQVAAGWEQLCAQAAGNTRRAGEAIVAVIDDATRTVWLTYAGTGHPKATD